MKRSGEKRCDSKITYTLDPKEIEQAILDYIANRTKDTHSLIGVNPFIRGYYTEYRGYSDGGHRITNSELTSISLEYSIKETTKL